MDFDNTLSRAKGAIWGALLGDAAGAYLEFMGGIPSALDVERALEMPGGGCWHIAPGQITDDGEMTVALARALAECGDFDIAAIARYYRRWYLSHPFDIGNATANALGVGDLDDVDLHIRCMENARLKNMNSKANGCLMRATPLGVWGIHREQAEVVTSARADCQLTHPNETCQIATAAYVIAIRHLLLHPDDRLGAFGAATEVALEHDNDEVSGFLRSASSGCLPPCHPQAGYLGIGFTHAFYHLLQGSGYMEAMRSVLSGGGDTDTNACIVGGLIGAATGFQNLPSSMLRTVCACDVSEGKTRPAWLQTRNFVGIVEKIAGSPPAS